ncbi:MAG: response regulator [Leptolyngbya sp.]|nr:response regulator [Candidatus Melainabacteria bacterium]
MNSLKWSSLTSGAILILDDDSAFRNLIAGILAPRGFRIIECESPEDAREHFTSPDIVLAIVDYRMPAMSGLQWIKELRDAGKNFPVIFCSAEPCDAKTFATLRTHLKVSLVLQKPIIPETFVQQVESLLPGYNKTFELAEGIISGRELRTADDDEDTPEYLLKQLQQIRSRLEIQKAIRAAQSQYLLDLERDWKQAGLNIQSRKSGMPAHVEKAEALSEISGKAKTSDKGSTRAKTSGKTKSNSNGKIQPKSKSGAQSQAIDHDRLTDVMLIAHKIRGTAGSLSLHEVGDSAGRLEDLLRTLESSDADQIEIIWNEIDREFARGSLVVEAAVKAGVSQEKVSTAITKILVVSNEPDVSQLVKNLQVKSVASLVVVEDHLNLSEQLKASNFSAVLIDMSLKRTKALTAAREVRSLPGFENLPVGFIFIPNHKITKKDLCLCGGSVFINRPLKPDAFAQSLIELLHSTRPSQPKVVVVDDDEVLTNFIVNILSGERMWVTSTNNPMEALQVVEQIDPDAILLDVMMPGLTGYEVCRQIRENKQWNDTPIIFLTSKASTEARAAAFAAGGNDHLSKPVLAEELITRISNQIYNSEKRKKSHGLDTETNLLLSASFLSLAPKFIQSALAKNSKEAICFSLILIDNFDEHRMLQGFFSTKQIVASISQLLKTHFRAEDLKVKWGENVFVLFTSGYPKKIAAEALSTLQADFAKTSFIGANNKKFSTTFSAAVKQLDKDGDTVEDLLLSAYTALMKRKRTGVVSATD